MITISNSNASNSLPDNVATLTLLSPGESTTWEVPANSQVITGLREFSQADCDESVGSYRIDFKIQDNEEYGIFSIWTNWNQLYYSVEPGNYVASEDKRVLNSSGNQLDAIENGSLSSIFFTVSLDDNAHIWVVGDMENVAPFIPPQD